MYRPSPPPLERHRPRPWSAPCSSRRNRVTANRDAGVGEVLDAGPVGSPLVLPGGGGDEEGGVDVPVRSHHRRAAERRGPEERRVRGSRSPACSTVGHTRYVPSWEPRLGAAAVKEDGLGAALWLVC